MRKLNLIALYIFLTSICFFAEPGVFANGRDQLKVAVVQYPIEGNQTRESFFKKITQLVERASDKNAELIVLPEWVSLDVWPLTENKSDREVVEYVADKVTPAYWKFLRSLSQSKNITIVGGSSAFREGSKIFNTAVAIFPNGKMVLQKKNYLTAWERKTGLAGDIGGLKIIDFGWGKAVIAICYDVEFPDLSIQLAKTEIDLIFVPSMTESPQGEKRVEWTSKARAVEHTSYVLISPTVGDTSKSWKHYGRALFLTPQLPGFEGILRAGKPRKPSIEIQVLDLKKLRTAKDTESWRPAKDMR